MILIFKGNFLHPSKYTETLTSCMGGPVWLLLGSAQRIATILFNIAMIKTSESLPHKVFGLSSFTLWKVILALQASTWFLIQHTSLLTYPSIANWPAGEKVPFL